MFRSRVWRTVRKDPIGNVLQDVFIHKIIDVQSIIVNSKSSKIVIMKLHVVNIHQSRTRTSQKFIRVTALKINKGSLILIHNFLFCNINIYYANISIKKALFNVDKKNSFDQYMVG